MWEESSSGPEVKVEEMEMDNITQNFKNERTSGDFEDFLNEEGLDRREEEYTVVEVDFAPELATEDDLMKTEFYDSSNLAEDFEMYKCNECDYSSKRKQDLKRHREGKHEGIGWVSRKKSEIIPMFKCNECDYATKRSSDLKRHRQGKHEGIRYSCDECRHSASDKSGLKRHKDGVHKKIKYPCNQCEFAGSTVNNLTRHKQRWHEKEILTEIFLPEPEIEINLLQPELTLTVLKSDETVSFEYPCDNDTGIPRNQQEHKKPQQEVSRYPFDECSKTFTTTGYLKDHKLSIHGGTLFKCNECDYSALQNRNLTRHIKSKHKRVGVTYSCDKCGYSTSRSGDLNRHVQSRHDGIKYVCEFCRHKFCDLSTLNRHVKIKHDVDRVKFNCDYCDYSTSRNADLKRHQGKVHSLQIIQYNVE